MTSPQRRLQRMLAVGLLLSAFLLLGLACGPPAADRDADGIPDAYDNCRDVANPSQRNSVRSATEVCVDAEPSPEPPDVFAYGTCANDPAAACLSHLDCTVGDACDCDLDGSGRCNISDFNLFFADFQAGVPSGNGSDLDEDGQVDADDFARFQPLFAQGSGGPGSVLLPVVSAGPQPGACYDAKWARRLWASEGRIPSPNGILDCSATSDAVPVPEFIFDALQIADDVRDAIDDDKNNPTNALVLRRTGASGSVCPNAAFSIASKLEPRACDAHDLCLDHCGTTADDCNRQFYRDLFNSCAQLAGSERAGCFDACNTYAMLYATAIATAAAGSFTPIVSPPADDSSLARANVDLERDLANCQCRPGLCDTKADCLAQQTAPRGMACDRGYCIQSYEDLDCTLDADCPDGYRCDGATGDCWFDVRQLPSLVDAPPPVCGDGLCREGIESCQATVCPEDCGIAAPLVVGEGRCGIGDACLLDRDCADGACLHGSCQRLADDAVCSSPDECASGSCDVVTRHCKSGCLVDQDCGTGVCSLGACIEGQPNGALCDANSDCASDVCNFPTCIAAGSVGPGGLCTTNGACSSGSCVAGICAADCGDGTCSPALELCGAVDSGLECNTDCGKCSNGTVCASNAVCQSGVCNFPICIAAGSVAVGGACTTNLACDSLICAAGVCAPVCGDGVCTPAVELCGAVNSGLECNRDCGRCGNGTACFSNAVCASGVCNIGFCRAAGSVGNGGICTTSGACASGNCFLGFCVP
jgi:hypothetical protein